MKTIAAVCAALVLLANTASAHAVVFPAASKPGAYEKYTLRVPNEKSVATTRIAIDFPQSMKVLSFTDVQGWSLEVVRDSSQRIISAVWTGTLPPQRFIELPFIAVNPKTAETVTWPVHQNYGSEIVNWVGSPDSKLPASVTVVGDAPVQKNSTAMWVSVGALLLSLAALGLALRRS